MDNHDEQMYKLQHSTAHVMAEAVLEMFPEGKLAFGPPIENGFYYDFDLPRPLTPEDLAEIEARMKEIIKGKYPFEHRDVSVDEAKAMFADQPYKIDLIEKLAAGEEDEHGEAGAEPVEQPVHLLAPQLYGPVPRAAPGPHGPDPVERLQAAERRRRLLARRREPADAAAHLWHGLAVQEGAGGVPGLAGRDREDATTAGWAKSWTCSASTRRRGRAWSTGIPRARASAAIIEDFWRQQHYRRAATRSSIRPTSAGRGCGRRAGTSTSTRRACTRRWTSTAWTTTSSR